MTLITEQEFEIPADLKQRTDIDTLKRAFGYPDDGTLDPARRLTPVALKIEQRDGEWQVIAFVMDAHEYVVKNAQKYVIVGRFHYVVDATEDDILRMVGESIRNTDSVPQTQHNPMRLAIMHNLFPEEITQAIVLVSSK